MNIYKNSMEKLEKIMRFFLIILMICLVGVVFSNIVLRYMGMSIRWADEVSRILFVWIAFIGMYIGYSRNVHPSFSLLVTNINDKNKNLGKIFYLVIHLSVILFLAVVIYGGINYIERARIQTTAVLRISVAWKYSAGPFGCFLMLLESLKKIVLLFDKKKIEFENNTVQVGE